MSIRIMTAVWDSQIQERGKLLVLLCLADHANDEGICHPSVRRLARRTRLTERHVYNLLSELESEGIVSRISRPGTSTLYRIHVDRLAQLPAEHPPTPEAQFTPEISSPLKSVHPTPEAQFTPPLKPSSGEPSINHKENLLTTNAAAASLPLEAGAGGDGAAAAAAAPDFGWIEDRDRHLLPEIEEAARIYGPTGLDRLWISRCLKGGIGSPPRAWIARALEHTDWSVILAAIIVTAYEASNPRSLTFLKSVTRRLDIRRRAYLETRRGPDRPAYGDGLPARTSIYLVTDEDVEAYIREHGEI
ncbi:MAG: hypothetical protein KatS3mg042_0667 [Rhodothermaceae bacterium]|nr:MAG: hypothetical protein KatS3mg042_0667 [Rhodothermaceae bacterium]